MTIIDAQVHIWSSGTPSGDHRQVSSYTVEELLTEMDAAGVDGAVIHPPVSWDPDANAVAEDAAKRFPDRFAVLGQVPLDTPETSRALLKGWRQRPGQCGLRYPLIRKDQERWPYDGTLDWLWPVAEAEGLPVATMAWRFLPEFARIAERHPELRLIIDHCGLIRHEKGAAAFANIDAVTALARFPNVALKATGAPGYSQQGYPFRDIHDGLHRLYDAFGPDRFFWGTDITRMPCTWTQCITLFTEELPWLRGDALTRVMGPAFRDWIGWSISQKSPEDAGN
ncbi:amidohydrolase [Roseomonas sp. HJA6]|uniref:Amidohydrolase n=1 Tax=Roseomonas alba TaxID=2846776 RepID=A0ABS7ABZ1_9PROT|nr:amidohydrolase family protein [Neoroseomonas alba]MBW6399819.1 amidohydrolase [Neoroseomonas alba]